MITSIIDYAKSLRRTRSFREPATSTGSKAIIDSRGRLVKTGDIFNTEFFTFETEIATQGTTSGASTILIKKVDQQGTQIAAADTLRVRICDNGVLANSTNATIAAGNTGTVALETHTSNKDITFASQVASAATLTTALAGANNDMVFTAKSTGTGGNAITIAYIDPGEETATESVVVVGSAIAVTLRSVSTDLSTAAQVKTAIEAAAPAHALVSIANSGGDTGAGEVIALTATALSGGVNADPGAWRIAVTDAEAETVTLRIGPALVGAGRGDYTTSQQITHAA